MSMPDESLSYWSKTTDFAGKGGGARRDARTGVVAVRGVGSVPRAGAVLFLPPPVAAGPGAAAAERSVKCEASCEVKMLCVHEERAPLDVEIQVCVGVYLLQRNFPTSCRSSTIEFFHRL